MKAFLIFIFSTIISSIALSNQLDFSSQSKCRFNKIVESSQKDSPNSKKLERADYLKIPASIRKNLEKTDIAFELGDGYYDLVLSEMYQITKPEDSSIVAGYLEWALVYYTEDNRDHEALVRYDCKGKRIGSIELSN